MNRFFLPEKLHDAYLVLRLERIDDAEEVYLNGYHINGFGAFPLNFRSALGEEREFSLPYGLLRIGQMNSIEVRVYDQSGSGGIYDSPVEFSSKPDISKLLRMDLSGLWKFAIGDEILWYVCPTMGAVLFYSAPFDSFG